MKTKKYATMTDSGAVIVIAASKKEAAKMLNVKYNSVYRY
jgi:hypothetical protein